MSFGSRKDKSGAEAGLKQTTTDLKKATEQTPSESIQYTGSFDIGKLLKQIFEYELGTGAAPQGYQSAKDQYLRDNPLAQKLYGQSLQDIEAQGQRNDPLSQTAYNQTLQSVQDPFKTSREASPLSQTLYDQTLAQEQNPDAYYQSILGPELQQAQDSINTYYQRRGLLNSGLSIESMGRAGIDLAIKSARERMNFRQQSLQNAAALSNQYGAERQQYLQNAYGLTEQRDRQRQLAFQNAMNMNQDIYTRGQNNFANLSNLYGQQQSLGQSSLGRQATGAGQVAQYQAYPYQAQLGSYYGGQAAKQALPGQIIDASGQIGAAMLAPATGRLSLAAIPAMSAIKK